MSIRLCIAGIVLASSAVAYADSILVGTGLPTSSFGPSLCPNDADCTQMAEQFTLTESAVVDQVKVVMAGPSRDGFSNGSFTVRLGDSLGSGDLVNGSVVGTGKVLFDPDQSQETIEVFDFTGLDLNLSAGTYYLGLTGGNVGWVFADPLVTSAGSVGPTFECDPFLLCRHTPEPITHAFEIDGNIVTPEPSTFVLLSIGALGLAGSIRRKFLPN